MNSFLKRYFEFFKELLFPLFCIACEKEGNLLCDSCMYLVEKAGVFCCPVCQQSRPFGKTCIECKESTFLDGHCAIGAFSENSIWSKIIHAYKYNFVSDAERIFENVIKEFVDVQKEIFAHVDLIVSVPLHRRRLAQRGFNQSEKIAAIVRSILHLPGENVLLRQNFTHQQAKLKKQERLANVQDAFILKNNFDPQGKNILLVDDVFTTGSTLNECAKVLKENKAGKIHAFTLARG